MFCCALCVAPVCAACTRAAFEYSRSYEGAFLPNNSKPTDRNTADMKLTQRWSVYECDGQWYLPVHLLSFKKKVECFFLHDEVWKASELAPADKQTVWYLPISAELAEQLRSPCRLNLRHEHLGERINAFSLLASRILSVRKPR